MKVVEQFEIGVNRFTSWLFLMLTVGGITAFVITLQKEDSSRWIGLFATFFFGGGYLLVRKQKILVQQSGFEIKGIRKPRFISWKEVAALQLNMSYTGHGAHEELKIALVNAGGVVIQVKQYKAKPMQRFFEILNEQCMYAGKNEHFIKQAEGKMNWRNKLKMF